MRARERTRAREREKEGGGDREREREDVGQVFKDKLICMCALRAGE